MQNCAEKRLFLRTFFALQPDGKLYSPSIPGSGLFPQLEGPERVKLVRNARFCQFCTKFYKFLTCFLQRADMEIF